MRLFPRLAGSQAWNAGTGTVSKTRVCGTTVPVPHAAVKHVVSGVVTY